MAISHMRAHPGRLVVKVTAAVVRSTSGSQSRRGCSLGLVSVSGKGAKVIMG